MWQQWIEISLLRLTTSVRYYAEWLDGEYVLLNQVIQGYTHSSVMQRAIKLHALFGSTIVLSDVQMLDSKTPIPTLFLDRSFRTFLNKKQNFLALVADPARGAKDLRFAIAMKGIERLTDQANKPEDSYEMAVTQLGEPVFAPGSFDADRYLSPKHRGKGHVARVIRRFSKYRRELTGLLYAVDYFSSGARPQDTTMPSVGPPGRYDTLLLAARNNQNLVSETQAKRIDEILRIQQDEIPESQHGRRAAIRKVLGTGQWQLENWADEKLRLYLDVVHAWNCTINQTIAPEAGTLYEAGDDLPLSRFERSVTDKIGLFRARPMPSTGLSDRIRRFLSWDPLHADWKLIDKIVHGTQDSAEKLQAILKTGNADDRADALSTHASNIADYLTGFPTEETSKWVWWIAKNVDLASDAFPSELVDLAEVVTEKLPYAYAAIHRKLIVNTLMRTGSQIL